ncbi:transcription factor Adf-1-like [Bactrocera tryoni]|uniref:transcription factor Adf-1-like n=1 Tax=Bactrocera tryoni TaxID=59916 RepID=UPI001A956C8E|nr:transcription factor Adf-1-like [Bactrocera tryoni]
MEDDECFIQNLIESVEKYKCLYEKKNAFYFNRVNKDKAWKAIAELCGKSDLECKHRWKLLRERFCKEIKRLEAPSGSGMSYLEEWRFLKPMMFLKDSVTPRRTRDNAEANADSILDSSTCDSVNEISSPPPKKQKSLSLESLYQKLGATMENIEKQIAAPAERSETDEAFMTTFLCLMQDLPVSVKDSFQEKMISELYRLRRENRQK